MNAAPGARLRAIMAKEPVMAPGVFNGLLARMAEQMGFQALYLSGAALSASYGLPDVGLITLNEFTHAIKQITDASSLPLIADADTGFGEALNVERTVRDYEKAGAAGLHLEDQEMPKRCGHLSGKRLVTTAAMEAKIRAACAARRDPNFIIIARTDARGVTGMEEALDRANAYLQAGADVIFVEALKSKEEFQTFGKQCRGPLLANMTEFGQGPLIPFQELAQWNYRIVIYPVSTFRMAMRAGEKLLLALKRDGQQSQVLPEMLTRQELYDLLGYRGYEERDRAYFGGKWTKEGTDS